MSLAIQEKMFTLIEQKRADQNVKSFCASNNIAEASYYYWQKRFRAQNDMSEPPAFIPIRVPAPGTASALATIQLPAGSLITIYHPEVISYIQPLL